MGSALPQSKLFEPLQVGRNQLANRVVLAPLTRFRADDNHAPLPFVKEYYAQRACIPGTLLITEATTISAEAGGYPNVPGIYTDAQIKAWKDVTDAIHEKGSYIWLQIWALGRTASAEFKQQEGTGDVVSSSDKPMSDDSTIPRPLNEDEIQQYIEAHATAAKIAVEQAGFDGVEIHAANGYLIDQFTQDICNCRDDRWGGSIENRSRFGLEVSRAVVRAVGADRTGIRISPYSSYQGMKMQDPIPQFSHLVEGLKGLELAYLHIVVSRAEGDDGIEPTETIDPLVDIWGKTSPVFLAGGFKPDSARRAVDDEYKNEDIAIVFGRLFLATPDLVYRLKKGLDVGRYDRDTFYTAKSEKGYIDYPFSEEFRKEAKV